jgi:hypothetical protein
MRSLVLANCLVTSRLQAFAASQKAYGIEAIMVSDAAGLNVPPPARLFGIS